jgi:1-acyl-sn-glycerol-3-phosphate acyltransferase
MLRFYYLIITAFPLIVVYIIKATYYAAHPEKYNEEKCYRMAQKLIGVVRKRGKIDTHVYGLEKLPKEGGYIMYANHQGRYDALGIMGAHPAPCAVVMDYDRARMPLSNEYIKLVRGKRLKKDDLRQQVTIMQEIAEELKQGRRYLLFPEGGYTDNHNTLQEFKAGSFKCAQKARCPIVPVAIWDSYKPFGEPGLKKVTTQVHFLEAIPYSLYEGKNTAQIRDMVQSKIEERMKEIAGEKAAED